jgi:hypothetical protein
MKNRPPIVDGLFYPFLVGKKKTRNSVFLLSFLRWCHVGIVQYHPFVRIPRISQTRSHIYSHTGFNVSVYILSCFYRKNDGWSKCLNPQDFAKVVFKLGPFHDVVFCSIYSSGYLKNYKKSSLSCVIWSYPHIWSLLHLYYGCNRKATGNFRKAVPVTFVGAESSWFHGEVVLLIFFCGLGRINNSL